MSILNITINTKMESIKEMRAKAMGMIPLVRIGKSGLTDSVVTEIKKQIEQKKIVKIKLLKAFVGTENKKKIAQDLAEKTNSNLVQNVGFIVVLSKK